MPGIETYTDGVLTERWDDDARTYTDFRTDPDLVRPYTAQENADADARVQAQTEEASEADLLSKARAAVQGNKSFLAISSPTNAQTLAQVKALTRQSTALIKLVARDLLDTSGT